MTDEPATLVNQSLHTLWQELTDELADIFDPHGVSATIASKIAVFTATDTVFGVSGGQGHYFDVWICTADGRIEQTRWDSNKASLQPLIDAGKTTRYEKYNLSPAELINSELWQLPHTAVLAIPLPVPGGYPPIAPPGVLCLLDPQPDCPLTVDNLSPLATNLTAYLERANLRNHVQRQNVEFAVVADVSHALTSTLSLQQIFEQLRDSIRPLLYVESVSVGLIDPPTGDITFVPMLMGPLFQDMPPIRLNRGQGIAGWVAKNRQPVIVNDVYTDKRFFSQVDSRSGFRTKSMICIPLQVEDRVIGVVQAINKQDGDFNENDMRMLQAIGGPMAASIENARLHADVTAEKRRIETIFANMSEGLITINAQGLLTHANDAFLTLLGTTADTILNQPARKVIRLQGDDLDEFTDRLIQSESDAPQQIATEVTNADGQRVPVLISGAPIIADESGELSELIFVFSDLRLIREVERMRDDFFHGIIHELRTPLATILMYARLLREGKAKDEEKTDRFLGVIVRESDRLQKMVRQMLQLAKMEAKEFQRSAEPVQLNEMFAQMLPPLADRAVEKGLTFRQKIEEELPSVLGDEETFYLIFKNLVDNAVKFTMSGTVRVEAWQEGKMVMVRVSDEGIGIPQAALPNLFGRFFRAQTAVERGIAGTGLGLYMVKEGVENYNGRIDVESVEGQGTTFTIRFPTTII